MMRLFFLLIALAFCMAVKAGDVKYPVSAIPAPLLKDAHVVKRMEEAEFRIYSTNETAFTYRYALTVLNENGDDDALFVASYDKLHQVVSIEGALYDAEGNQLRKVKSKDIMDMSAVDDISLIDDHRRKVHHFHHRSYPYTVVYEVVQRYNNTLFFPMWVPQDREHVAIEQSSYTIIAPQDYAIRYKAFNYAGEPATFTEKSTKRMQWTVRNLPAIIYPFAAPSWNELTTLVYFAPSSFEIQGYKGDMSSWKSFGKFQTTLNQGRDVLPPDVLQKVAQLTAGVPDPREKVNILYRYLQKNTRYISIQLGLGGWQPFEAAYVAKKGYGDCKALTNYMHSLLKAAGIASNYALVYAGNNKDVVIEDFPVNRFNHVILCVPMQKDSIWLECTNQSVPAGYMGDFTGNRKALLITEEGGALVSTPQYNLEVNTQLRGIKAKLAADGGLDLSVNTVYSGLQQDDVSSMLYSLSNDEVKKRLNRLFSLSSYDIADFKYKQKEGALPRVEEELKIMAPNYATVSGRRLFINPNILNRGGARLTYDAERKVDYVYDAGYRDVDSAEIEIPAGYQLEAPFQNISLQNKFGTYNATVKIDGNRILYRRVREQNAGRFPAKDGKDLLKFLEDIYKADHSRIVLLKKETTPVATAEEKKKAF